MPRSKPLAVRNPPISALHVVGAAIVNADRCLAAQRAPHVSNALRWEFPGGKVELGEDPKKALAREIAEELGVKIEVGAWLGRGEAVAANGRQIWLDVYLATLEEGEISLTDHQAIRWISAAEIGELDWAAADLPILPRLAEELHQRRSP